ncbi:MAG: acyl-CoA thioesterase [Microscillaceae bacterium]|jgi:acyl-CoA thioester hydrolase|nr:acyl-CoA thioesterase [Microscillaceae bacterium]
MPNSDFSLTDFRFCHELRVRWAEVDAQAIVFNGHYLMYFDVAITEYFRQLGITFPDGILAYGTDMFVKKASVEYHAPARFDNWLKIYVRVAKIGTSSVQFLLEIIHENHRLISGEVIYVNANPQTHQSVPLPQPLREKVEAFEERKF